MPASTYELCGTATDRERMPASTRSIKELLQCLVSTPSHLGSRQNLHCLYKKLMRYVREFSDERIPLAYFITFRAYGTWLHGREGSVDRFHNRFGSPKLPADVSRLEYNRSLLRRNPVRFASPQRNVILAAIKETCDIRNWRLWAANVRSNHVHTVVTARIKPEPILNALKANATRKLKEAGLWRGEGRPWVRRGSKKYLWDENSVRGAIAYVLFEQGD